MTKTFINSENSVQGNESVLKDLIIDNNTFNDQEPFTEEDSKYIHYLLESITDLNNIAKTRKIILKQITILDTDRFDYTNYLFTFEMLGSILTENENKILQSYYSRINQFMHRYNNSTENAGSYQIVRIQGTNIFQAFYQIG